MLSLVPVTTVFAAGWLAELVAEAVDRSRHRRREPGAERRAGGRDVARMPARYGR